MKKVFALKTVAAPRAFKTAAALCCLFVFGAACSKAAREPRPEILGVRLGMSRDEARAS